MVLTGDISAIGQDEADTIVDDLPSFSEIRNSFLAGILTTKESAEIDNELNDEVGTAAASARNPLQLVTWDRIMLATGSDPDMHELVSLLDSGMPESDMHCHLH